MATKKKAPTLKEMKHYIATQAQELSVSMEKVDFENFTTEELQHLYESAQECEAKMKYFKLLVELGGKM